MKRPEIRYVNCRNCRISKRFPDPECAEHYAAYHREAFEGHEPTINGDIDREDGNIERAIRALFREPELRDWDG